MKIIYIVEDHQVIRDGVRKFLEMEQYMVLTFADLASARQAIRKKKPDLLIQDVMLPDGDGFDFVAEIKNEADIPVIFMTAKIGEEDRIKGLELGADDYITKPFSLKELVLRVNGIFRRIDGRENVKKPVEISFMADNLVMKINTLRHTVSINGNLVELTTAEWKLLDVLIAAGGETVPREEIIKKCFGYESDSYVRIADTHVKNLRAKLEGSWISTERGVGYRFTGEAV